MVKFTSAFQTEEEFRRKAENARKILLSKTGPGSEYTGWVKLPADYDRAELERIKACASRIRENADVLIVIGIGGSYLGARAATEFLYSPDYNETLRKGPKIRFAGNGIDADELKQIMELAGAGSIYLNVISKSGTTLEPALAFRVLKTYLEEIYGKEEAAKRIICTTDKAKGALKELADKEGYECFVVPDDVGGRYSVLTAVGLLPLAAAGADIDMMLKGAGEEMNASLEGNCAALSYAAQRQSLYSKGKKIEILSCPSESLRFFGEWWKQLYGESEGKDGKGIFPASVVYTADLHSMGQYIQDGERILQENFISIEKSSSEIVIRKTEDNDGKLNYLDGMEYREIYACAEKAVLEAHEKGGVNCGVISIPEKNEYCLGALIYFFEFACGISAYMQDVNPFNQPGVEEYKKNMFALLGKE